MDVNTLQQLRNVLMDRRGRVVEGFDRERSELSIAEGTAPAEIIDMAQALEQLDRDSSLHEQERKEMTAIDKALGKMITGTFGVCEDCDEEIPVKRLLVLPEASLCAKCQEFEERAKNRNRGPSIATTR